MNNSLQKVTKHRSAIAPWQCDHCGVIWYGSGHNPREASTYTLCTRCILTLENHLWSKHEIYYGFPHDQASEELRRAVTESASTWIQDKNNKPLPKPEAKRFHTSVPKWMRSAINEGMVKTNGKEVYVVYSSEGEAIQADLVTVRSAHFGKGK